MRALDKMDMLDLDDPAIAPALAAGVSLLDLAKARAVHRSDEALADAVLLGTVELDVAYELIRERRRRA